MKPLNTETTVIPVKTGSVIIRALLVSVGLFMSQGVLAQTYILGDIGPGGGIVFFLESGGTHGLEAQAEDYDDGSGYPYWDWIEAVAAAASYNDSGCDNSLRNPDCWHLPTKTELELLYEQRNVVEGFTHEWYWSSTSYDDFKAWMMHFLDGSQHHTRMNHTLRVRAVRAF